MRGSTSGRSRWERRRIAAVCAAALVVALVPFAVWQGADGGPTLQTRSGSDIVVVGDSITARYVDRVGDEEQGWWSMVGHRLERPVDTYAQSGSGYLRHGAHCTGTTFAERTGALDRPPPAVFIIEGGRNDWATCRGTTIVPASNAAIASAVDAYLDLVARALPDSTRVVVLGPPWGPLQPIEEAVVTPIVRQSALAHGFEFVDTTGTLPAENVLDGVHPNRAGNEAIARRVLAALA